MSEHTSHIAIFEDTNRMVQHSEIFCQHFKSSLKEEYEIAAIASESKSGDLFIIPFIKESRQVFRQRKSTRETRKMLAAALGWISHKSADIQVKPLARKYNYDSQRYIDPYPVWNEKIEALQDITIFKNVYEATNKTTNSRYLDFGKFLYQRNIDSLPIAQKIDLHKVEHWMASMWKADFLGLHDITEQTTYDDAWLKELFQRTQTFNELWDHYIEAYNNPDTELEKYLIDEKNFYNPQDQLIQWVRNIQKHTLDQAIDEKKALEQARGESASQYAKILANAYLYITAADDFFNFKTDEATFLKAWEAVA
jgi:hypothetical protein